ncbi:MAG TPA: hypothetical protein VKY27_06960 [Bacteriovoracaceae bacterium]|nr:hypothetical protein [Bacteriovoracaceae bacterium]
MSVLTVMLSVSMLFSSIVPSYAHARVVEKYEMKVNDSEERVNSIIDQFHYKMTVEWDQKDALFKKQAEEDLKQNLLDLEASGVSLLEVQKTMEKKVLNGKFKAEYERFVSAMKGQNLSDEEINAKTMEFIKKNYQEGVDFTGKGGGTSHRWKFVTAVLVIVVIAYIVHKHHHHDDEEPQEQEDPCECEGYYCDSYYPIQ